jgi:ferredoxin
VENGRGRHQEPVTPTPAGFVVGDAVVVDRAGLDQIILGLRVQGYLVLGPTVQNGAVSLGDVQGTDDLPIGWHDVQGPGSYRLEHGDDETLFAWAVGPTSVKKDVFPPRSEIWRAHTTETDIRLEEPPDDDGVPTALFGVRPCETAALEVLDRVLGHSPYADPAYRRHRPAFVITAECTAPGGTCFCASMNSGPWAESSFDLALIELRDQDGHRFLVRIGSEAGARLMADVAARPTTDADMEARESELRRAVGAMGRTLDVKGLPDLLGRNMEHPRWDDVADRCLACGNCTLVCPTCFCSTIQDTTDLSGSVTRERLWSSCFDLDHSYLHGGAVRQSTRSRYRQWMTHKLSTWWAQFGTSGCVGCGRCITWCPVGIDITEEAAAIRSTDGAVSAVQEL